MIFLFSSDDSAPAKAQTQLTVIGNRWLSSKKKFQSLKLIWVHSLSAECAQKLKQGLALRLLCKGLFYGRAMPHWQILGWNVSKSWLQKVNFFENYAIVAMQSDNVTFFACKIIKVTLGFYLKKTFFFTRLRHHLKNSWNIFQIQITPLLWHPQDPQGV